MEQFITGAIAMGSWVAALFFLRFWKETRDRLFAVFAVSFTLLGLTRLGRALMPTTSESENLYWIRFLAFALIVLAVLDKNRSRKSGL